MRRIIKTDRWSCLVASFCMVLDIELEEAYNFLGHKGEAILWPDLPEPLRRRSFHIQEMIDLAFYKGFLVTPIEPDPGIQPKETVGAHYYCRDPQARMQHYMLARHGVITGLSPRKTRHAVAWNGVNIFDPDGGTYRVSDFNIETFWMTTKIT